LNQADAATLRLLRGIGPVFSERIIRFRDALGGFVSVAQLQEVYGLPDSTYQQIKGYLSVSEGTVRKLLLNEVTETELAAHAYIGKRLAGRIIALRHELGDFTEMSQLKKIPLINEEKYRKIAPYLSLP
jgi:competence protein ComEA